MRHSFRTTLLVAAALVASACGTETAATTTTAHGDTTTTAEPATTTTEPQATTTTAPQATTTTLASTTTTASGLPGTPIDFGPSAGDVLMVIGVAHDDVLNLRAGPGTGQAILDTIEPTYMDLVAKGKTRELPNSLWVQVDFDGTIGWVNLSFVGYAGLVEDQTASVVAEFGGTPPSASSMTALGQMVADTYVGDEEPIPDVVRVTAVTSGDLHEVSYDVVGFGDDAVRGVRLHIFGEPVSGGFRLKSVEALIICGRGVDSDGACV